MTSNEIEDIGKSHIRGTGEGMSYFMSGVKACMHVLEHWGHAWSHHFFCAIISQMAEDWSGSQPAEPE
jgi:hypothetical protein